MDERAIFVLRLQGNCQDPPSASSLGILGVAPLWPRLPGQCVVVISTILFEMAGGNLWLDSIYLRHQRFTGLASITTFEGSNLWMTDVYIQGDGKSDCSQCGLILTSTQAHVMGTAHFMPVALHAWEGLPSILVQWQVGTCKWAP